MPAPSPDPVHRVAVLIPTYDERDNLPRAVARVRAAAPEVDVVVLDDNSPDGTGQVADALAAHDDHVIVIHRPGKQGLGVAYLHGFDWALARGYDAVVEMDADGSHPPERLPALLAEADRAEVVIGSRWVPGGRVLNWPAHRKLLSVGGNTYIRALLGVDVRDATAGFRVYRTDALRRLDLRGVESQGYCFQVDMTWRCHRAGMRFVELPIDFVEREVGQSKMSGDIVREALVNVTVWGLRYRAGQLASGWRRFVRSRRDAAWHRL